MAALVVIAFNLTIEYFSPNLPPQQLLQRIREKSPSARLIFLGDSQMAADADPVAFSQACSFAPPALNAGLGATYASEHCLILEYLLPYARSADTVIYGFFDTLLTEAVPATWHDLVGNRAVAYLFPDRASALLAGGDAGELWRMRAIACLPMVRERMSIWAKVERLRRRLSGFGLPQEVADRFGRAKDFTVFEPRNRVEFEARLNSAVEKHRPLNRSVQEIVDLCAANHLKLYLIEMPVPTTHRDRFYETESWAAYRQHVQRLVASADFVDASDWLGDENFADPLHLNAIGATAFSARLAQEICRMPAGFNDKSHPPIATTSR
jgi:hypothetical protein